MMCLLTAVQCVAFPDVNPQAPLHFVVVPKRQIGQICHCGATDKQVKLTIHLLLVTEPCNFLVFELTVRCVEQPYLSG